MKRRRFIKAATATAAGLTLTGSYWNAASAIAAEGAKMPVPKRPYRDGIDLSVIGCGAIVLNGQEQKDANREIAATVDRGINYFDVAPTYGKGEAERKLGPALEPYRKDVFLACKTQKRDAAGAAAELEQSLKRLRTDYFDLYQLHAVRKMEDVEKVFAPGGAMETFLKAREEGKIRYIGFSAHSEEAGLALLDRFAFDSVLYPFNYVCWSQGGFGPGVMQKAKNKGAARLALKALAYTPWAKGEERTHKKCWYRPIDDVDTARRALSWTLSQDVTAAIPPGDERIYRIAVDLAAALEPMSKADQQSLIQSATDLKPLFRA